MKQKRIFNNSEQTPARRRLRKSQTFAERILWQNIKNRQVDNLKFRRQYSIGKYIIDFYCAEHHLAIELDGEVHEIYEREEYDKQRQKEIELLGITMLRFKNKEVTDNLDNVLDRIKTETARKDNLTPNPSPQRGEGK